MRNDKGGIFMQPFTRENTPAEIVNLFPKAGDLFKKHDINFCCKGDRALHIVLKEKEMEEEPLLEELNTRYEAWSQKDEKVIDWESMRLSSIIDHIQENYHAFLDEELEPLEQFVTRVNFRHGGDQPHLVTMYNLYLEFKDKLINHLNKEEEEVFPLIKQYEENPSKDLAARVQELTIQLENEHEEEVNLLNKLRKVTHAFTPPATACNTYRITYARLAELEENTLQHVHVENNILLKRLKTLAV
jgi:regulator of cell morphogenesis and NO signaling